MTIKVSPLAYFRSVKVSALSGFPSTSNVTTGGGGSGGGGGATNIRVGSTTPSAIYVGSTQVTAVYVGSTLVWGS